MTFGTTKDKPWVEALPAGRGASFEGRTFSRFHLMGRGGAVPNISEIRTTPDNAVEAHALDADELFYVPRVEIPDAEGRAETPEYDARVWSGPLTDEGVPRLVQA